MYKRLSGQVYDALHDVFKDYTAECRKLREVLHQYAPAAKTLLDVTCGTGRHLEQLRKRYYVEGLDMSAGMLRTARKRCPGVRFHRANMVNFRLRQRFDVIVCLFSSIAYVRTAERLRRTIANLASHLQPGGIVVVEPWFSPDTYWTGRVVANFVNKPELKIVWMYTSKTEGRTAILDSHYLVGTPKRIDHFTERYEVGLFRHTQYLKAFQKARLAVHYNSDGLMGRGMYIGLKQQRPK
jgi:dTDP-3-amino-3,4,6-trideoxy-alpha-D-glucopyranose N,N-dimethyltransferase